MGLISLVVWFFSSCVRYIDLKILPIDHARLYKIVVCMTKHEIEFLDGNHLGKLPRAHTSTFHFKAECECVICLIASFDKQINRLIFQDDFYSLPASFEINHAIFLMRSGYAILSRIESVLKYFGKKVLNHLYLQLLM